MKNNLVKNNRTHIYLSYLQSSLDKIFWQDKDCKGNDTANITRAPETAFYHLYDMLDEACKLVQVRTKNGQEACNIDGTALLTDFLVNILTDSDFPTLLHNLVIDERIKDILAEDAEDEILFPK